MAGPATISEEPAEPKMRCWNLAMIQMMVHRLQPDQTDPEFGYCKAA